MLTVKWIKRYDIHLPYGGVFLLIMFAISILPCFLPGQNLVWGDEETDSTLEFKDNIFIFRAKDIPLKDILDELLNECQVEIQGLEGKEDDPVTFDYKGGIEQGIRELMKYLGEKEFIFEFHDTRLSRVVLSQTEDLKTSKPFKVTLKNESPTLVVVKDISEGSQAEKLGLKTMDIIQEYDGVVISTARQLKTEVEKKKDKGKIIMLVKRDDESIPVELAGGAIGVKVGTEIMKGGENKGEEEEWEDEDFK